MVKEDKVVLPVTVRAPVVEALVTVSRLVAELKVKFELVARAELPLPNRMSEAVTALLPVPPLLTGITPVMAMVEVPEMAMLVEPVSREPMSL